MLLFVTITTNLVLALNIQSTIQNSIIVQNYVKKLIHDTVVGQNCLYEIRK